MNRISIVVGLNFGDEGKGATVNSLIKNPGDFMVVRFNGGHQVGHTVVLGDTRHPFSNFGSGTLKGTPTYWSEYCTVNPMAVKKEGDILRSMGYDPMVYYNANAMVTTPYDIFHNVKDIDNLHHGTVGVGFGKTIQRNEDHYHLYVRDLLYPTVRDEKLNLIALYYGRDDLIKQKVNGIIDDFKKACDDLVERYKIAQTQLEVEMLLNTFDLIFEGGQGIMLDMDYGFFPHVTRSHTTSKNAIEIIQKYVREIHTVDTFYITRAYQTRHGNGPMTNVGLDTSYIKENPDETNKNDGHQGIFRKSVLDLDLLKYAISCDRYYNRNSDKHLVITCLDQVDNKLIATHNKNLKEYIPVELGAVLGVRDVYLSNSDKGFLFL